jgi:hypothetical protein
MAYDNTNRGVLFRNTEKEDPKHADYKGNINVNGEQFWLNAWVNTSSAGVKYMALSIKPKVATDAAKVGERVPFDDEIPLSECRPKKK